MTSTETEYTPTITSSQESVLPDGQRELMLDVRTQDMELNMGPL